MAITNVSKPTSTIANATKINIGLIWDSATMTWDAATFTWDSTASLIGNVSRVTSSITNISKPA